MEIYLNFVPPALKTLVSKIFLLLNLHNKIQTIIQLELLLSLWTMDYTKKIYIPNWNSSLPKVTHEVNILKKTHSATSENMELAVNEYKNMQIVIAQKPQYTK